MTGMTDNTNASSNDVEVRRAAQTELYEFLVTRGLLAESDEQMGRIRIDTGAGYGNTYKILISFPRHQKQGRSRPSVLCAEVGSYGQHRAVSYMVDPGGEWRWKVDARVRVLLGKVD